MVVSQEQKSIIFPIFTSCPAPHLWFLYMAATSPVRSRRREVSVLYDQLACAAYRRRCVRRLYTPVYSCMSQYTQILYTYDCISVYRFYTRLLFRQCCIRRLEPPRKIFTTVKTADVCCRPVSVLRPTEKGQHALIVILGIRRPLGQNSLDTETVEG